MKKLSHAQLSALKIYLEIICRDELIGLEYVAGAYSRSNIESLCRDIGHELDTRPVVRHQGTS